MVLLDSTWDVLALACLVEDSGVYRVPLHDGGAMMIGIDGPRRGRDDRRQEREPEFPRNDPAGIQGEGI